MRIEDIDEKSVLHATDYELYNLRHTRFPQFYKKHFKGNSIEKAQGISRADFLRSYLILIKEMNRRRLRSFARGEIEQELFKRTMFGGLDVPKLGDIVIVENYVSVGGSFIKNPAEANDIDIIIRDREENRDEGLELKIGRILARETEKNPHFVYSLRGPHSSYIPLFDLVLRAKPETKRVEVKESLQKQGSEYFEALDRWDEGLFYDNFSVISQLADGSVLDLGCGTGRLLLILQRSGRPVMGIDKNSTAIEYCLQRGLNVLKIDLESQPLPIEDQSWDNVIGVHFLEHLVDPELAIEEAQRVARKKVIFLVPLGKRADPTHQQIFNDPEDLAKLLGKDWKITELKNTNSALAILTKRTVRKKALRPFGRFNPPKPTMAGLTEAFSVDQIWGWAKGRELVAEPKLNGLRVVLCKEGKKAKILTEARKDLGPKVPEAIKRAVSIPDDFILDCSIGIERDGKPLPRIKIMTLMAEKPELQENDVVVLTCFDLPFWKIDLHDEPFKVRREKLEKFFNRYLKNSKNFDITPYTKVKTKEELEAAFRKYAKFPQSEGIVIKDVESKWSLTGSEPGWAKLKVEAEIKAQVVEKEAVKGGRHTYLCGVLKGKSDYTNTRTVNGRELVILGKTFTTEINANPGDILTIVVEEIIPQDSKLVWLGARVLDRDDARSTPYAANQIIGIARRANILQKKEKTLRGIYLVKPHGSLIMSREKSLVIKSRPLPDDYVGQDVYLVEGKAVLGIVKLEKPEEISQKEFKELGDKHKITEEEAQRWGFDKKKILYAYRVKIKEAFDPPVGYDPPQGVQTVIREVTIEKREREGTIGEAGNIDFGMGDKGQGVLQLHIMGIEEEKIPILKKASSRLLVARADPRKLESELLRTIGNHGAHIDIRLRPSGKNYWEGGEIMIGNIRGLSKLEKLKTKNQKLRFGWKVGHKVEGKPQAQIVRGPLDWLDIGKRKVEISEPGEVGATAHKYAAFLNIDTFNWELYKADEHAKKFKFSGGRYLDGNFLFSYVPVAVGGRIWMMNRLSDDDYEKEVAERVKKLDIESFRAEGVDEDIKNPKERYRQLLADLRYLGNSAYPRLKQGEKWGDWDLKTTLRYFAKVVDALRSIYMPVRPPDKSDKAYNSSYWKAYREAERYMKTKPPSKEQEEEWNKKRRELLKSGMMFRILKLNKKKQIAGGIVYEPYVEDSQGDYTDEKEIEEAMHKFMEKYGRDPRRIRVEHEGKTYYFPILESFQPEKDTVKGNNIIPAGAWWLMIKITNKAIWKAVEKGELTGFSMGGRAKSEN